MRSEMKNNLLIFQFSKEIVTVKHTWRKSNG